MNQDLYGKHKNDKDILKFVTQGVETIKHGIEYNKNNDIAKSISLANIGWVILDYTSAFKEAVSEAYKEESYKILSIPGNIYNKVIHPMETIKSTFKNLSKKTTMAKDIIYEYFDLFILTQTDPKAAQEKINVYKEKLEKLCNSLGQKWKETTGREIFKFCVKSGTKILINHITYQFGGKLTRALGPKAKIASSYMIKSAQRTRIGRTVKKVCRKVKNKTKKIVAKTKKSTGYNQKNNVKKTTKTKQAARNKQHNNKARKKRKSKKDAKNNNKSNNNKPRIENIIKKTDFFRRPEIKRDYKFFKKIDGRNYYKRVKGRKGIHKKAEFLCWDHLHNDLEIYKHIGKKMVHAGSIDPATYKLYKPPVIERVFRY